jgi:adenylate kinase
MRLVLIGAPGAGKGTQSSKICKYLDIPHLSTGNIFRTNIKQRTKMGLKVEKLISQGELVPDEITMEVVQNKLDEKDCEQGFLMDGFPRTVRQAEFLDQALQQRNLRIDFAINLLVGDDVIIQRMSGRRICTGCGESYHVLRIPPQQEGHCDFCGEALIQRPDDDPETVLQRLDVYHAQTGPIIDFYRGKGILIEVVGIDSAEDTANEIFRNLGVLDVSN